MTRLVIMCEGAEIPLDSHVDLSRKCQAEHMENKMREVTHFVVVFPTRLMAASYEEKKELMAALKRSYPHYEFDAMEAFEGGIADDDEFSIIPVTGVAGQGAEGDEVALCRPLDPLVIPSLMMAITHHERLTEVRH